MMNGFHNGWGMGGYVWIIVVIVLVVLIWVVVKLVNQNSNRK
jgi:heme exporter protein D